MSPGRQAKLDAIHGSIARTLPDYARAHIPQASNLTLHPFHEQPLRHGTNDAKTYLYLWMSGKPSAYIGWNYESFSTYHDCAGIKVIQGVYHNDEPKPVPPAGWAASLINCLTDNLLLHPELDVSHISIVPAEDNLWYPRLIGQLGMELDEQMSELIRQQERMKRHYDGTARSLGFELVRQKRKNDHSRFDRKEYVYHKKISNGVLSNTAVVDSK